MEFAQYFPVWDKLTTAQQALIRDNLILKHAPKGTVIHNGSIDCTGILLVKSGQLRAYILSEAGREVTVYRLFERDMCLFSASCMMRSIQFEITIETEKDSVLWFVPVDIYKSIMEVSAPVANFTNELMATRFSEVMWLVEQILWKSMDKRVAAFLLDEVAIEGTPMLKITHEIIANHLGSHREVMTRILRYLQGDGLVSVSRGTITVLDEKGLRKILDA